MLDRDQVIKKAYTECMTEMYTKAQPPTDYYQLLEDIKSGKIGKDENVYERHYLSYEEFIYIRDKYIKAYGLQETWKSNIEVLEDYLINGGTKDKYIAPCTDEYGYHPGYRGYEKVEPIINQIQNILKTELGEGNVTDKISNKITETILNTITNCKEFYRFDREEGDFSCLVALGASPTSDKELVTEYWKSQGIDLDIEIRNPLLFWEQDYYGDEFEEVMKDEYGENWKDIKNNEWKEKVRKDNENRDKKMQELLNKIKDKENG